MFNTVLAHYDGHRVVLDEEVEMFKGQQLLVTAVTLDKNTIAKIDGGPQSMDEAIAIFRKTYNL